MPKRKRNQKQGKPKEEISNEGKSNEEKSDTSNSNSTTPNVEEVFSFFELLTKLKDTKRTGWVNHRVQNPESISDHMYRMAIMSFLIQDANIDKQKCIKMSLCHDMAESIIGDITPDEPITKEEKHKIEREAFATIKEKLKGPIGEEMYSLYLEYEEGKTEEAKFVKQLDRFEMIEQAYQYEKANVWKHPQIKHWVETLKEKRSKLNLPIEHTPNYAKKTKTK